MKKKTFAVDIDGTITENGVGRIHLDALEALRRLTNMGHDVIYVTGRSSVEAYLLSVFGGTKKIAVGENGGCIAMDTDDTILLGNIDECNRAFELIKNGELELDDKFIVSENAWRLSSAGYSSMFIMVGDEVSVEDLLKGIIVASGNDACVA